MTKTLIRIFFSLLLTSSLLTAQTVYYTTEHTGLYEYLDEMASINIIQINSAVKPYSRIFIASCLKDIQQKDSLLNKRQKKELEFFLRDFNKELMPDRNFDKRLDAFYYKDSLFTFSVNPIAGAYFFKNQKGDMYQRWVGAEAFAYIDKHWGFYASLRDFKENKPFSDPLFLEQRQGAKYKATTDYSDMKGGISYSWHWGHIAFVKDQFIWGNNYNGSNIFSGRTPSFAQVRMNLHPVKWFDFNYVHGWLISEVLDSTRVYVSYNTPVIPMRKKYLTSNIFTFRIVPKLAFSFGNSVIYPDIDYPGYMIPLFFYKSVAHTYRASSEIVNAQMFFDISSRQIQNVHLYSTFFVDEMSFSRMFDKTKQSNYFSFKAGTCISNMPLPNTSFIFEYTRTNPLVYQHNLETTTFESNRFNLGHYLRDNAEEFYVSLIVKPIARLRIQGKYQYARKGHEYAGNRNNVAWGQTFMSTTEWKNRSLGLLASYQLINDLYLTAEYRHSIYSGDPQYTAPYFWGNTVSWIGGLIFGF